MRTIKIRVPAADLGTEMAAMRKWLDDRTCEPSRLVFRMLAAEKMMQVSSRHHFN